MDEEATQPSTQPPAPDTLTRGNYDGFFEDELADVICTLHPANDFTRKAIADVPLTRPQHVLQHERLPAASAMAPPRPPPTAHPPSDFDIALRMSAEVLDVTMGFTFGRTHTKADIALKNSNRISQLHFRIYLTDEGVLMLQDNSTNGTYMDTMLLNKSQDGKSPGRTILVHGAKVAVLAGSQQELSFFVKMPIRFHMEIEYQKNLQKYRDRVKWANHVKFMAMGAGDSTVRPPATVPVSSAVNALKDDPDINGDKLDMPVSTIVATDAVRGNNLFEEKPKPIPYRQNLFLAPTSRPRLGRQWDPRDSNYLLMAEIGKGAFAVVFKASRTDDGKLFAIKELEKRAFKKANITDTSVSTEVQIMSELSHPNIVQYIECIDKPDFMYVVMEYVPCGNIGSLLKENGAMSERDVKAMTLQCLEALTYLQKKRVTHRDIKPDNILIASNNPFKIKLADFGLSKISTTEQSMLTTFCGTLYYCAPEVYDGYGNYTRPIGGRLTRKRSQDERAYNSSCDIWSLGAVIFHALTNQPPFDTYKEKDGMLRDIMTQDLNARPLRDAKISRSGVSFVKNLLNREPSRRPHASDCLRLPWLAIGNEASLLEEEVEIELDEDEDEEDEVSTATSQLNIVDPHYNEQEGSVDDIDSCDIDYEDIVDIDHHHHHPDASEAPSSQADNSQVSNISGGWSQLVVGDDSDVWASNVNATNTTPGKQLFGELEAKPSASVAGGGSIRYPVIGTGESAPSLRGTESMMEDMNMNSPNGSGGTSPARTLRSSPSSHVHTPSSSLRASKRAFKPSPQEPGLEGDADQSTPQAKKPRVDVEKERTVAKSRRFCFFPSDETYYVPTNEESYTREYCQAQREQNGRYKNWVKQRLDEWNELCKSGKRPEGCEDDKAYVNARIDEEWESLMKVNIVKKDGVEVRKLYGLDPESLRLKAEAEPALTGVSLSTTFSRKPLHPSQNSNASSTPTGFVRPSQSIAASPTQYSQPRSSMPAPDAPLGRVRTTSYTTGFGPFKKWLSDPTTTFGRDPKSTYILMVNDDDNRVAKRALCIRFVSLSSPERHLSKAEIQASTSSQQEASSTCDIVPMVSTQASRGVWVNNVRLKHADREGYRLWTRLYTGDVIKIVKDLMPPPPPPPPLLATSNGAGDAEATMSPKPPTVLEVEVEFLRGLGRRRRPFGEEGGIVAIERMVGDAGGWSGERDGKRVYGDVQTGGSQGGKKGKS